MVRVLLLISTLSLLFINCSALPRETKTYLVNTEDGNILTYSEG